MQRTRLGLALSALLSCAVTVSVAQERSINVGRVGGIDKTHRLVEQMETQVESQRAALQQAEANLARATAVLDALEGLRATYFREMSEYDFYLDPEKQRKLSMRREPVLRYPTPADFWGETYVWTDGERPVVVGSVFGGLWEDSSRRVIHEFHSLAPEPLFAEGGATGWQPEEKGIEFEPIPDAGDPAEDEAGRLAQMLEIAGRFGASMTSSGGEVPLRFLPYELYRYERTDQDPPVIDGALFAFAAEVENDPEVLLVIEAQQADREVRWKYAPVRFTNREACLKYRGEEVWRFEAGGRGIFDGVTSKRYGVFFMPRASSNVAEE